MKLKRKVWYSIGMDPQGDACIYAQYLKANGDAGKFLSEAELQEIVDALNESIDVYACRACGRPESQCSANPCVAVQRDRAEVL